MSILEREVEGIDFGKSDIVPKKLVQNEEELFIASKNGTKYYRLDCSGASRIKKENIVSFSREEDAIRAGYDLSKTCK